MPEDIKAKKITELAESTAVSDEDLFVVGSAGTPSLRKTKWTAIWNKILEKIRSSVIVNNLATQEGGYAMDARLGAVINERLIELNANMFEDITDKFNWGTAEQCYAVRIGKVVLFQTMCTVKSASVMNFASTKDSALNSVIFNSLNAFAVSGVDTGKLAHAYINNGLISVQTYDKNCVAAAWVGNVRVKGWWIIR